MADSIKELETQVAPLDASQRNQFEMQRKFMADQLRRHAATEQQDRAEEIELSSQLQKEQAILSELTEQLNHIDRKLKQVP